MSFVSWWEHPSITQHFKQATRWNQWIYISLLLVVVGLFLPVSLKEVMQYQAIATLLVTCARQCPLDTLKKPVVWVWCLLWIYQIIVTYTVSPHPDFAAMSVWTWIRYPLFLAAMVMMMQNTQQRWWLAWLLIVIGGLAGLDTLWQYLTGVDWFGQPMMVIDDRLTGPLSKPRIGVILGFVALPVITLAADAFSRIFKRGHAVKWQGWVSIASAGLLVLGTMLSGERGACVRLLVAYVLLIVINKPLRKCLLLSGLAGCLAVGGFMMVKPDIRHRYLTETQQQYTSVTDNSYRYNYINALRLWAKHPLTGIGPKQYRLVCPSLSPNKDLSEPVCYNHPHGWVFQWLSETGLIGSLLWLAVIVMTLRQTSWTLVRQDALASSGLAVVLSCVVPVPLASIYAIWLIMPWCINFALTITPEKFQRCD